MFWEKWGFYFSQVFTFDEILQSVLSREVKSELFCFYQVYAALPASAPLHIAFTLRLMHDALNAAAEQISAPEGADAATTTGSTIAAAAVVSGDAGHPPTTSQEVAALQASAACLEKLRDLLDKSHKALRGMSIKHVIGALVQVRPCHQLPCLILVVAEGYFSMLISTSGLHRACCEQDHGQIRDAIHIQQCYAARHQG